MTTLFHQEVWAYTTSLTLPLFIDVACTKPGKSCICVWSINLISFYNFSIVFWNSSVSVMISVFRIIPTYWSYFRLSHFIKVLLKFYVISYFVDKPVTQQSETYSKVYMYAGIIGK
jgi:hypothetical protein